MSPAARFEGIFNLPFRELVKGLDPALNAVK